MRATDGPVWVTGASSGIGRALALRLARQGYAVAASARGGAALEALAAEAAGAAGRLVAFPLDVTDAAACAEACRRIEAEMGLPAAAVLNAGTHIAVEPERFAAAPFRTLLDVNVMGAVNCLAPLVPAFLGRRSGTLAIVSSVAGYSGLPTAAAYGASKAALINMAEAMKLDLERFGVRVVLINPGFVETPLTAKNPFPMPFLMKVDDAVERIVRGLEGGAFEIAFPRRFVWMLKFLRILPYRLYFPLVHRFTGL